MVRDDKTERRVCHPETESGSVKKPPFPNRGRGGDGVLMVITRLHIKDKSEIFEIANDKTITK